MTKRESPEYYRALEDTLRQLLPDLQQTITLENWRWFEEWIRAGEYGLAVEVAAEGLAALADIPSSLAAQILAAAKTMEIESEPIVLLRSKVSAPE